MDRFTLPKCRQRGTQVAPDRWTCVSNRLVVPARVVSGEFCAHQCPYVDHETLADPFEPPDVAFHGISPSDPLDVWIDRIDNSSPEELEALPAAWPWWEIVQVAHRELLSRAIEETPTECSGDARGRGIIIAAGGNTYFPCAYVATSVLRAVGCKLPVEFWYLEGEINREMAELASELGVRCRDASSIKPQPRALAGWELKPFAAIHSAFQEVLFLDADNIVARDPTYLFDAEEYQSTGAVFWPDLPPPPPALDWIADLTWNVAGIRNRERPAFETGQWMIDKARCWRELCVTMHLNEHSDFWYRYVYGDKDTFKLAWHKLERNYAMPDAPAGWKWPAIRQHDFAGNLVFSHTCQGKEGVKARYPPANDSKIRAGGSRRRRLKATNPRLVLLGSFASDSSIVE